MTEQTIQKALTLTDVTSRDVALWFEKRHDAVLRDIKELRCSPAFRQNNFRTIYYREGVNKRKCRIIVMTPKGFLFLMMGFKGEKPSQAKEFYFEQFLLMLEDQALNDSDRVRQQMNELASAAIAQCLRLCQAAARNGLLASDCVEIITAYKERIEADDGVYREEEPPGADAADPEPPGPSTTTEDDEDETEESIDG